MPVKTLSANRRSRGTNEFAKAFVPESIDVVPAQFNGSLVSSGFYYVRDPAHLDISTSAIHLRVVESTTAKFNRLADLWESQTRGKSLLRDKVEDPAYREILGMDKEVVVPLIIQRLAQRGGFWFGALCKLTEENPIRDDEAGDRDKMTVAWLRWWLAQNAHALH